MNMAAIIAATPKTKTKDVLLLLLAALIKEVQFPSPITDPKVSKPPPIIHLKIVTALSILLLQLTFELTGVQIALSAVSRHSAFPRPV